MLNWILIGALLIVAAILGINWFAHLIASLRELHLLGIQRGVNIGIR